MTQRTFKSKNAYKKWLDFSRMHSKLQPVKYRGNENTISPHYNTTELLKARNTQICYHCNIESEINDVFCFNCGERL